MNLIECINELIKNKSPKDNDLTSEFLLHMYQSGSKDEQKIINNICRCLTGFQFDTVLLKAGIGKPFNKLS